MGRCGVRGKGQITRGRPQGGDPFGVEAEQPAVDRVVVGAERATEVLDPTGVSLNWTTGPWTRTAPRSGSSICRNIPRATNEFIVIHFNISSDCSRGHAAASDDHHAFL